MTLSYVYENHILKVFHLRILSEEKVITKKTKSRKIVENNCSEIIFKLSRTFY